MLIEIRLQIVLMLHQINPLRSLILTPGYAADLDFVKKPEVGRFDAVWVTARNPPCGPRHAWDPTARLNAKTKLRDLFFRNEK